MTSSERPGVLIARAARHVAMGRLEVKAGDVDLSQRSGLCLAFVRRIVEIGLELPPWGFYTRFGTERVEREPGPPASAWWARDLERSMRNAGLAVPTGELEEDGDLLFNWRAAPNAHGVYVGHVGVLADASAGIVIENINPAYRRHSLTRGTIALTPRERFPVTTTIRIRELDPDPA